MQEKIIIFQCIFTRLRARHRTARAVSGHAARKARRLTQPQAQKLWQQVERVRRDANAAVASQGFLSAGERASYDRALDMVAAAICR